MSFWQSWLGFMESERIIWEMCVEERCVSSNVRVSEARIENLFGKGPKFLVSSLLVPGFKPCLVFTCRDGGMTTHYEPSTYSTFFCASDAYSCL